MRSLLAIAAFATSTQLAAQTLPAQPPQQPQPATPPAAQPAAPQPVPEALPPVFPARAPSLPAPAAIAPPAPAAPPTATPAAMAPGFDYSRNLSSDAFGANLFTGAFAQGAPAGLFNPDHVVSVGDQLQVRLWGAFDLDAVLTVDPKGNIFMPQVGPVRVAGVANRDLPRVLEESIRRTFRANVHSYISLAAAQPVRVFVTGFVNRPGMYHGTSNDSVLRYLDQAGGIDTARGSFIDVQVLRRADTRARFNLYDFLLSGVMPALQLGDGDVIVAHPRKSTFLVLGLAENAKRFEFSGTHIELGRLIALARPLPQATHARVTRQTGVVLNTEYYALGNAESVPLANGDQVEFTADKRPGTITVRVEGEHQSPQEYVLPYGARFGEVIGQIQFSERSDVENLQLFRVSIRLRQKAMLQNALKTFESAVLTARSGTSEEARLRTDEANLMLQWVARAATIEPLGQVVIAQARDRDELLLENGDVIRVPSKNGLVLVNGEVLFPNAVAHNGAYRVEDYIKRAGGYSQNADTSRLIVAHRDGSFDDVSNNPTVRAGDEILVLPKVDTKSRQFWKDITQIIFQIALSAKVVFGL